MFTPNIFMVTDPAIIRSFISNNGFAALVLVCDGEVVVDHLPFVLVDDGSPFGVLRGHFARANALSSKSLTAQDQAVAIFQGPHAYVSASLYPSKVEHGRVVPTWNYTVAHVRGPVRLVDDAEWIRAQMTELTMQYESHRVKPWRLDDAPAGYIDKLSRGVMGIEMDVKSVQCKWKLSQNQAAADYAGVVEGMTAEGRDEIVDYMHQSRPPE